MKGGKAILINKQANLHIFNSRHSSFIKQVSEEFN